MKNTRIFIIAIIVLFVAMMFIEMAAPKHFVWKATFTHNDEQPFGSALFDSVMAQSLPQGYSTTTLTLSQLETAIPANERRVYLITTDDLPFSSTDEEALMRMLHRGDHFVVASGEWSSDTIEKVLHFEVKGYVYPWMSSFKSQVLNRTFDTLQWVSGSTPFAARQWLVPGEMIDASISAYHPSLLKPLVVNDHFVDSIEVWDSDVEDYVMTGGYRSTDTIAGIIRLKYGDLVLVACPLMFTNYGVVECDGAHMALRILSLLDRYPVVRLDPNAKTELGGVSESPLRYVLSQPPMKWAVWLLIVTVILAMVFTARRRQRVIPVMAPPVNRSLEMVKHIGSLYFHRHDNADLLTKKYQYFVEEVRCLTMIDLDDENHLDDAYLQLQHQSGIPRDELKEQLQNITGWTYEEPNDKTLMRCIDYLNQILNKIK